MLILLSEDNIRAQNITLEVPRSHLPGYSLPFHAIWFYTFSKYVNGFEYQGLSKIETQWDGRFGI